MPSILDYLDHPEFLQSVVGMPPPQGMEGFGQQKPPPQPQAPPPPPPPQQAPAEFGQGNAGDGGGGLSKPDFNDRFNGGPMPGMPNPTSRPAGPMSFADRAAPAQNAVASGDFDPQGRNYTDFGLSPSPDSAMAFAGAPQTRNGFPYEMPGGGGAASGPQGAPGLPGVIAKNQDYQTSQNPSGGGDISVNRTPRNGMSVDDMQLDRPTPAGNPMDIRSPAQRGAPDPRIARARAFGNFLQGLGKGMSAVGAQRPGASKLASFAAGAGGSITGYGDNERHNLDRDEKGLDRAERGRERDQTFDYQNRTLASTTDYHNKLINESQLKRLDARERERWSPVGRDENGFIVYADKNSDQERRGDIKTNPLNPRGDGAGGATERLAQLLVQDAAKRGEKLTLPEAVKLTRGSGNERADNARLETIAKDAFKHQEQSVGSKGEKLSLDQWRQRYGLPPFPQARPASRPNEPYRSEQAVPPGTPGTPGTGAPQAPVSQPPPPNPGEPPAQWRQRVGLPPVNTPNGAGGAQAAPAPRPAPSPAPPFNPGPLPSGAGAAPPLSRPPIPGPGAAPPRPPAALPGAQYSPSRNAWRNPDGTMIPGAPPQ